MQVERLHFGKRRPKLSAYQRHNQINRLQVLKDYNVVKCKAIDHREPEKVIYLDKVELVKRNLGSLNILLRYSISTNKFDFFLNKYIKVI